MKQLISSRTLVIPEGVSVEVKARRVRVKGPRGECGNALEGLPGLAAMLHAGARPGALAGWRLRLACRHQDQTTTSVPWTTAWAWRPPPTGHAAPGGHAPRPEGRPKHDCCSSKRA